MKDFVNQYVEDKMRSRYSALEGLAKEFLSHTGLTPDRCELVEQQESDGRTSWKFVERDKMFSIPVPGTADGQIRSTLITNAKAGKFGDIKIDESASTLHILVRVLEHLLKPPQVWLWHYEPGNQASHEAALAAAREASDRANVVMPTHYGSLPITGAYSAWKCSKCQNIYGNLETTNREAIFDNDGITQVGVRQTISHYCGPCGNVEKKTTNHCVYCNAEDGCHHHDDCKWLKGQSQANQLRVRYGLPPIDGPDELIREDAKFLKGQLLNAAKKINEATNSMATDEMRDKAMREIVQSMPLTAREYEETQAAEKQFLGFSIPGTYMQQEEDGSISIVKPNMPVSQYVQIVEPKCDRQYDPPDDDTPMPIIMEKPK